LGNQITFTRVIVMPDGQRYVEGVTPKQLPPPTPIDPKGDGSFEGPDGAP
jgi:hypothetical protein